MSARTEAIGALRARLVTAFEQLGAPAPEAAAAAQVLLDAELRGHDTHGVRLVANVRREYAHGSDRRQPVSVQRETAVSAVVDGGFHLSPYVHARGAQLARDKALATGIAVVGVVNAGVSGALGVHAAAMSGTELVALALNSSPSVVVAPGSAAPRLGSNPLAMAVPGPDGDPVVLDMATSALSFNGLRVAAARGAALPAGVAVDADGRPTTDPAAAVDATGRGRLLPFGGHRGFGLAFMIELLVTGNLSDAVGAAKIGPELAEPTHFPGVYLAYRADLLDEPGRLAERAGRLIAELGSGARYPGRDSGARRRAALQRGSVEVQEEFLRLLDDRPS